MGLRKWPDTNEANRKQASKVPSLLGFRGLASSRGRTRTCDMVVNSHPLYQLSYAGIRCAVSAQAAKILPETEIGVKAPISLYYRGLRSSKRRRKERWKRS